MKTNLKITTSALNVQECLDLVTTPQSGGIDLFVGTVRNATAGKEVIRLEFEAYEPMALREMQKIVDNASGLWPLHAVVMHHRIGNLEVGETAVIIAVSAAHRDAAFDACRYLIDTLKQTVPIWKKEIFLDGEVWVSAHP